MKRLWFWQMKKTRQKKDHKKGQKERDNGMMADGQLTGSVKFASNYNWENVQKDCGFDRCNYNYNYNWENVWKGFDRCLWQSVDCWWLLCEWDQDWKAFRSLNLVEVATSSWDRWSFAAQNLDQINPLKTRMRNVSTFYQNTLYLNKKQSPTKSNRVRGTNCNCWMIPPHMPLQ